MFMKILMIEDNKSVSEMMGMFFQKEKWEASFAYDGNEAVDMFNEDPDKWDMITLDLNLPGKDGMEVAKEIRKVSKTVPIIMLTARDTESDQVLGLEFGADDYVTKPFSPITLIARMKAIHRRDENMAEKLAESTPVNAEVEEADDGFDINTGFFKLN